MFIIWHAGSKVKVPLSNGQKNQCPNQIKIYEQINNNYYIGELLPYCSIWNNLEIPRTAKTVHYGFP